MVDIVADAVPALLADRTTSIQPGDESVLVIGGQ
jgi:hypothetical protein